MAKISKPPENGVITADKPSGNAPTDQLPDPNPPKARTDYFEARIHQEMGLTPAQCHTRPEDPVNSAKYLYPGDDGSICIDYYDIEGNPVMYEGGTSKTHPRPELYTIRRLPPDLEQPGRRYIYPPKRLAKETHPLFTPIVLNAYRTGSKLPFIAFTEGPLKGIKLDACGVPAVAFGSLTLLKKGDGRIDHGIKALIKRCKPAFLIFVIDADCIEVKDKAVDAGEDLAVRPRDTFEWAGRTWQQLLKPVGLSMFIRPVFHGRPFDPSKPKGIDDLLNKFPDETEAIVEELKDVGMTEPGRYFHNFNVTDTTRSWTKFLGLYSASDFYKLHHEAIGHENAEFVYKRGRYKGSKIESEGSEPEFTVEEVVPAKVFDYFRCEDKYYRWIERPDTNGDLERVFRPHSKDEVVLDIQGKRYLQHVPKYATFVNVPNNVNHQPVINGCLNTYAPLEHVPAEGNWDRTKDFLKHIFDEQLELGLDYLQLIYTRPTQILPILCLVSKERDTGKTTFGNWLKRVLGENMSIVGNGELSSEFNASYAGKLVVCCDETFIDKQRTMEKIKMLATADKIFLRLMRQNPTELAFYGKFVLISNNETNFINTDEQEIRFWVRKVPQIPKNAWVDDHFELLSEEIPAFLYYLQHRNLSIPTKKTRMWFSPADIRTQALDQVVQHSKTDARQVIEEFLEASFTSFPINEIYLCWGVLQDRVLRGRSNIKQNTAAEILAGLGGVPVNRSIRAIPVVEEKEDEAKVRIIKTNNRWYRFGPEVMEQLGIDPVDRICQMVLDDNHYDLVSSINGLPDKAPFDEALLAKIIEWRTNYEITGATEQKRRDEIRKELGGKVKEFISDEKAGKVGKEPESDDDDLPF